MTGTRNRPGKNEREAADRRAQLKKIRDEAQRELDRRKTDVSASNDS